MIYLAKTNPEETIQEHTDNLLINLKILRKLYPDLKVNWDLLYYACLYHDLGKMNSKFQLHIRNGRKVKGEIPHTILSLPFINVNHLEKQGFSDRDISLLFEAIAYHHDRSTDFSDDEIEEEISIMQKELSQFHYEQLEGFKFLDDCIDEDYYMLNTRTYQKDKDFYKYVMLKGLLNRLDYAASGHIEIENENNFLDNSLNNLLLNWKKQDINSDWNELQKFMVENRDENIITIAQTGMGKTEAGLLWIGNHKGFFTLPIKAAINEIYKRITTGIVDKRENVGLLHSDTFSKYLEKESEVEDIQDYYNKTKQLSLPLTVCTLDQLFDFVYLYRGFEPKLATLSYSKVVIDEIQMYSPDLLAYLILGLEHITKVGGKFAILTATFPTFIEDKLIERGIFFKKSSRPFIDKDMLRHSVKIIQTQLNTDKIVGKFSENKILIVCNTVKKAQDIYEQLNKSGICKEHLNLIHSKFTKHDRAEKEKEIMKLGDANNTTDYGIWIGTQVVEASLDIDFDLLFTELSDINGLLQRMGRCYRKRQYIGNSYNCYVYVGDEYPCSGIRDSENSIIDIQIFQFSKEALLEGKVNGFLTEEVKLNLVNQVYSTDKIRSTKYNIRLEDTLNYVKTIDPGELNKHEVTKRFRNILNVNVIPQPIYDQNIDIIERSIIEINRELKKGENYQTRKKERYQLLDLIRSFTVSVSFRETKSYHSHSKVIKLGKFEEIIILDCNYSYERGIILQKNKVEKLCTSIDDVMDAQIW
ncbi:MAG: CRISPR-associated helicase Cas3' [Lachnotalea sp.]